MDEQLKGKVIGAVSVREQGDDDGPIKVSVVQIDFTDGSMLMLNPRSLGKTQDVQMTLLVGGQVQALNPRSEN